MKASRPALFSLVVLLAVLGDSRGLGAASLRDTPQPPANEAETTERDPTKEDAVIASPEEAVAADAAKIAEDLGMSTTQTRALIEFHEEVDRLVSSLPGDVLDGTYAGAHFADESRLEVELRFKGEVRTDVLDLIHGSGLDGVTALGGRSFSLTELQQFTQAAHRALIEIGFNSIETKFDLDNQEVQLDVVLLPDNPGLSGAILRDEILERIPFAVLGVGRTPPSVLVTEIPSEARPIAVLDHTYGGAGMRDDGVFECTTAFTITTSGGTEGVLTASHCEGINQVDENNANGGVNLTYNAPFANETLPDGEFGDIEWHTTSHDEYGQFWATNAQKRNVTGRIANVNIDVTDPVCRYGRASQNQDCGTVTHVSVNKSFSWGGEIVTSFDMVEVQDVLTMTHDSGGPWYLSQTAWGIHHGSNAQTGRRFFSKIQNAELAFNITIQLGS